MDKIRKITLKERNAILKALKSGVVPPIGLQHIQEGRDRELREILSDISDITQGGATIRIVSGDYGAGKTFFLHLTRLIALRKGLIVMHADLAPDRRLQASSGQARALFTELTKNCSTQSKREGGALKAVVERFIDQTKKTAIEHGQPVSVAIRAKLADLEDMVSGYDFANVLTSYYKAFEEGDQHTQNCALRWLRGEYNSKMEARKDLQVHSIIDDANIYSYLKLYARFAQMAGYKGLLVSLDEMVNLYKLQSAQARKNNYEQILGILNDILQGSVKHFGILLGGTPEFIKDERRGLYSYEALQSRLAPNSFALNGLVDQSGPIITLDQLTKENLFVLLENISLVYAKGDEGKSAVNDLMIKAFMQHCQRGLGESYFRTPRNTIKAFVNLLAILEQNPDAKWEDLVGAVEVEPDIDTAHDDKNLSIPLEQKDAGAGLASFNLGS